MSADAAADLAPCPFCGEDHGETSLRCPRNDMTLPLAGRLLAGKYRLLAELGRGGMGAVWRARNVHVGREVALKLLLPEVPRSPELVARFQDEARVAARIGHPGICDILDLEVTPLGPVIVMELLRGENLAQRIAREGRLPRALAVPFVREAALALEAAHRAGVIHRDLKPENLFLHQGADDRLSVKLMDFGISKFLDRTGGRTASGALMGTPEYMAPEQVVGAAKADARTDVWALGAVLYKALTGLDPFTGDGVPAILLAIVGGTPPPAEPLAAVAPPELVAVVLRCLSRDPAQRFASARELAEALQRCETPPPALGLGFLPTLTLAATDASAAGPTPDAPALLAALTASPEGRPTRPLLDQAAPPTLRASPDRRPLWLGLGALVLGALAWLWLGRAAEPTAEPIAQAPAPTLLEGSQPPAPALPANIQTPVLSDAQVPAPPLPTDSQPPEPPVPGDTPPPAPPVPGDTPPPTPPVPEGSQPPAGLLVAGDLVTPAEPSKPTSQRTAKRVCAALAEAGHLGSTRWKLANPSESRRFTGAALKSGAYWTSANHRGRGLVIWLPRGNDSSVRDRSTFPRPLCVAPRP